MNKNNCNEIAVIGTTGALTGAAIGWLLGLIPIIFSRENNFHVPLLTLMIGATMGAIVGIFISFKTPDRKREENEDQMYMTT